MASELHHDIPNLAEAINAAEKVQHLFFGNQFELAKRQAEILSERSMYHALIDSTILFVKALITFKKDDIIAALKTAETASNLSKKFRKTHGILEIIFGDDGVVTDAAVSSEQMHAELIHAECLLVRGILTFLQDDKFSSFISASLKLRTCYLSFKNSQKMLDKQMKVRQIDENLRLQLECGIQMGTGAFELLLSSLNAKHLRLLGLFGMHANKVRTQVYCSIPRDSSSAPTTVKEAGINKLKSSARRNTLRSNFSAIFILAWNLCIVALLGIGDPDWPFCDEMILKLQQSFPRGFLVLYFEGRIRVAKGQIQDGVTFLQESVNGQIEWKQFHNLCYWELILANCCLRNWKTAEENARKLLAQSQWSPSFCCYMIGVFNLAQRQNSDTATEFLSNVRLLCKRIAGKSVPIEKFCVAKVEKYKIRRKLVVAHYEFLNLWNGFDTIRKSHNCAEIFGVIIQEIDETITGDLDGDEYALCLLLKGICLKNLNQMDKAISQFEDIFRFQKKMTETGKYLVPSAHLELARIHLSAGRIEASKKALHKAQEKSGYLLKSRLYFKFCSLSETLGKFPK